MNGIETLFIQNFAAVTVTGAFLWYLVRKDKQNKETFDNFNATIQNHFNSFVKSETRLAKTLQKLTDCIKNLNKK